MARVCKGCKEPRPRSMFTVYTYSKAKRMRVVREFGHCESCRIKAKRIQKRRYDMNRKVREWEGMSHVA